MVRAGQALFLAALAAALGSPARAAELPKEPAIDLSQLCKVHGSGFKAIEGTDICMRIGGSVAVETGFVAGGHGLDGSGREDNGWRSRAEGEVGLETRIETDIGTIRTILEVEGLGLGDR